MKTFLIARIFIVAAFSLTPAQTNNEKASRDSSLQLEIARVEEQWQQFMSEYRWTDVFVKRDGRWQCVAAQVTSVPEGKSE